MKQRSVKKEMTLDVHLATTPSRVISVNSWYLTSFNLSFYRFTKTFRSKSHRVRLSFICTIEHLLFGCFYYNTGIWDFQVGIFHKFSPGFLCITENFRVASGKALTALFARCYNKNVGRPCLGRFFYFIRLPRLLIPFQPQRNQPFIPQTYRRCSTKSIRKGKCRSPAVPGRASRSNSYQNRIKTDAEWLKSLANQGFSLLRIIPTRNHKTDLKRFCFSVLTQFDCICLRLP